MVVSGLVSLVVLAGLMVVLLVWVHRERESSHRRRKFLRRFQQESVSSVRTRVARDLADEDTHVIPKVPRGRLPPDPLQEGKFSGLLPLPRRVRRYVQRPVQRASNPAVRPETELMQRILNGLRNLD